MKFGDKIRELRNSKGYSQQTLAQMTGLSLRSIQNYESNQRHPNNISIAKNIASALGTTVEALLDDGDMYVISANERGGAAAGRDLQALLAEVSGLFAGGKLSEDDKDKVMRAINDMYWKSKEINKKYSSGR